jgi:hypothetical protein
MDAAYEAASRILNDFGLGACKSTIEPHGGMWELRLERITAVGRTTTNMPIDHHQLKESLARAFELFSKSCTTPAGTRSKVPFVASIFRSPTRNVMTPSSTQKMS